MPEKINEGETPSVTLSFTDENGTGVTPTTAKYKLVDSDRNTLLDYTTIVPVNPTYTIIIPQTYTVLSGDDDDSIWVIAEATYGSSQVMVSEYEIVIHKIRGR